MQDTALRDAVSSVAKEIASEIVAGLNRSDGKKTVYNASKDAAISVQGRRSLIALSLSGIVIAVLTYYGNLKYGAALSAAAAEQRGATATFSLAMVWLLLYFVQLRGKAYQAEELKHLNDMVRYEDEVGASGAGHRWAEGYKDKYWVYSQVDMAVFGCFVATLVASFYDLVH